ncbi:MAG: hypothetical protein IID31_03595, partial [Planctomycetes bacterium]|nr:hypothetical protein [Planctomycetota bacterium]
MYLIKARESFRNKKKDSQATLYGATGRHLKGAAVLFGVRLREPHPRRPCYPDCDPDPVCDIFDFLCFQDAFVAG